MKKSRNAFGHDFNGNWFFFWIIIWSGFQWKLLFFVFSFEKTICSGNQYKSKWFLQKEIRFEKSAHSNLHDDSYRRFSSSLGVLPPSSGLLYQWTSTTKIRTTSRTGSMSWTTVSPMLRNDYAMKWNERHVVNFVAQGSVTIVVTTCHIHDFDRAEHTVSALWIGDFETDFFL